MSRIDAIRKEQEDKEKGSYGPERKWYISEKALEKFGLKQFKAKEGTSFLRIIPPEDPNEYFGLRTFIHYNMGPNDDAFLCPRMMLNQPCPICERRDKLQAAEADKAVLKALSCFPPRYLYFVVDVSSRESEAEGVQVYDAPQTINEAIIGLSKNRKTGEVIDISDPDNGKVLLFDRTGTKAMNTRYTAFELDDGDPIPDEWLAIPKFQEVLHYGTDAEMLTAMGAEVRERDHDPEPEAPRSRSSRRAESEEPAPQEDRRRRGAAPAEEPPAEEPPARRRRGTEPAEDTPPSAPPAEAPPAEAPPAEAPPAEEPPARRRRGTEPPAEEPPARRRRGTEPPAEEAPADDDQPGADDVRSRVRERLAARRK